MKSRVFLFFILLLLFSEKTVFCGGISKGNEVFRIKGAQVFVLDKAYKDNLDAFFLEAKNKGVNTVFFRVFHNSKDRSHLDIPLKCESGVYFDTQAACVVNNLLPEAVKSAKKHDIKIFAWMATRSLSFLKDKENLSLAFNADGGETAGYGANIFKKEVRDTILQLFKDLAKNDIDGVLFQDDFIIKYNEGADEYAKKLFEDASGIKAERDTFFGKVKEYKSKKVFSEFKPEFYIWADWKSAYLAEFFKELKEQMKTVSPKILFAANVYYETPVDEKAALSWYSQKLPSLLEAGADYLAVMGYYEQIKEEQNLDRAAAAQFIGKIAENAVKTAKDEKKVIMKLQSRSFTSGKALDYEDFKLVCRYIKPAGDVSIAAVPVFSSSDIVLCP